MSERSLHAAGYALLVVATLISFWPVGDNGFVSFDDPSYISRNEHVRPGLTADGFVWAFTHAHAHNWHPLTWLSHMADVELFGLSPGAHHRVNLGLHALNACLLLAVLRALTGSFGRSLVVALLFAVHPLRVESVAWASERKDVLAGVFWLLTIAAWARWARRPSQARYVTALACFALGLLAKPTVVVLPVVLLLLDVWPLGRTVVVEPAVGARTTPPRSLPRLLLEKTPFFALAAIASAVTLWAQQGVVQSRSDFPLGARLANAAVTPARYLARTLWPHDLAVFYPYRRLGAGSPELWIGLAVLAAATAAVVGFRRRGYPLTGWGWFLVTLVPTAGIVQVGMQSTADRYTYLAGIGVVWAVVWAAADRLGTERLARTAGAAAVAVVLVILGALTWRQSRVWRDDESLYGHAVRVTHGSFWAEYNYGVVLLAKGRREEARAHFEEAVAIDPGAANAWKNLGVLDLDGGHTDAAVAAFRAARRAEPDDAWSARHLARALNAQGASADAETAIAAALRQWPDDPELLLQRGVLRLAQGRTEEAVADLERAVAERRDDAYAANALGIALGRSGRIAEAAASFREALRRDPDSREAAGNLAQVEAALEQAAPPGPPPLP